MDHQQVCTWLGMSGAAWPPDHYTLLGLTPGEADAIKIEEHVHDRLMRLRAYQLNHPEQVTEAMNRLARAFTCLTDPTAKRAYDAAILSPVPQTKQESDSNLPAVDPLAWLFGPWSNLAIQDSSPGLQTVVQADWNKTPPPPRVIGLSDSTILKSLGQAPPNGKPAGDSAPVVLAAGSTPLAQTAAPLDPFIEAARLSADARRGLGTGRALFVRVQLTRKLLRAWQRAGRYLNQPQWRISRSPETVDLFRQLHTIRRCLIRFPPLLGEAGQPGFWVASLARQQMIVPILRSMLSSQRETLARDWRDGQKILRAHRQFLMKELKGYRRISSWDKRRRALQAWYADHPSFRLALWGLVAVLMVHLLVAIWLLWSS